MITELPKVTPLSLFAVFLLTFTLAPEVAGMLQVSSTHRATPPSASESVKIGTFYLKKKNYKAALSRFLEAIETDPYFAPAHRQLGKVYEKMGMKREALRAYKAHLEVLPSAEEAAKATHVRKAIARLALDLRRTPRKVK